MAVTDLSVIKSSDLPMEPLLAEQELSVQKTADFLDTSARHVNDMLDNGVIQYKNNNIHRMVLLDSLLEYDREVKRKLSLLEKIVMQSEEIGLYDDE